MENKWIYINEITTLHADDDGVCLSNEHNQITFNVYTLFDWLPEIIEVAMKNKDERDEEKIEQIKCAINEAI